MRSEKNSWHHAVTLDVLGELISVQLSEPEFEACILPYLSMPKRGPKCKLGYYRVFNLIVWLLYTGMQWKCLPVPTDPDGTPAIHYTTVYKVFAKWADDGSLWQAFVASVRHLATEKLCSATIPTVCHSNDSANMLLYQ
jgi:transposase